MTKQDAGTRHGGTCDASRSTQLGSITGISKRRARPAARVALVVAAFAAGCSAPVRHTLSPPFESRVPPSAPEPTDTSDITPDVTGIVDEVELCELVRHGVRLRADDVPAGAAITIAANTPANLEEARHHGKTLEQALAPVGEVVAHRDPEGAGCGIADLAENDLSVRLDATLEGMRLELTTADPHKIDVIRRETRAFVDKTRASGVTTEPDRAPP